MNSIFVTDQFIPVSLLANPHLMTIVSTFWARSFTGLIESQESYLIDVDKNSKVLVEINRPSEATEKKKLIIAVHGLEGCSRTHYMCGVAVKGLQNGFSVARMNLRNCGGTMHLTDTLYNAGMSGDVIAVAEYAHEKLGYDSIYLVGYSLGGNIVLKAAAELASEKSAWLKGVCAISPSCDLSLSVDRLEIGMNKIYELNFLISLKKKIVEKAKQFPDRFNKKRLPEVKTVRQFDEIYTSSDGGYSSASDYYAKASSLPLLSSVDVPTLIIAAQDDPIVPFSTFEARDHFSDRINLLCPEFGGHGAFVASLSSGARNKGRDRFWAEDRAIEFIKEKN